MSPLEDIVEGLEDRWDRCVAGMFQGPVGVFIEKLFGGFFVE